MKRSYYQIEGDLLSARSIPLEEQNRHLPLIRQTLFTSLPIEIIGLIVTYISPNAFNLQHVLRFLLLEFGISLVKHATIYSNVQSLLLDMLRKILSATQPAVFEKCREFNLVNISYCASKTKARRVDINTQYQSIQTILSAKYSEIYTFINYCLCECCKQNFSDKDEVLDEKLKSDVTLCDTCGSFNNKWPFFGHFVDYEVLRRRPSLQYTWITEARFKKLCCIPRSHPIKFFFDQVRQRILFKGKESKRYYLLKDALPYIKPECRKDVIYKL